MNYKSGTMDHTADLGLWVEARSKEELFISSALALAELMTKGPRDGRVQWLPVGLESQDLAGLLVSFLNEVIYLLDGEGLLTVAAKVTRLDPVSLEAGLGVIPLDSALHEPLEPVKAATYHQALVEPRGSGWRAEVILDT